MRTGMICLFALVSSVTAPALAAPMLVVSFDARISQTLSRALAHEGAEVVGAKNAPPRLRGQALAIYLRELAEEHEPELIVLVGPRGQSRSRAMVVVSDASGKLIASLSADKAELTSATRARELSRTVLALVREHRDGQAYERAKNPLVQVSSAYPAFAVPPDAPLVGVP